MDIFITILPFLTLALGYFLGMYPYRKLDKSIVQITGATLDKVDKHMETITQFAHTYSGLSVSLINQLNSQIPASYQATEYTQQPHIEPEMTPEEYIDSISGGLP